MKSRILCKLLILFAIGSISIANATEIVTANLSEKTPLHKYADYSVHTSAASLKTVIFDNNWQSKAPQKVSSSEAVWVRIRLKTSDEAEEQLTCLIEEDVETEFYVNQQRVSKIRYFVKSLWMRHGIAYFYNFKLDKDAYLYLKILPKSTASFDVTKYNFSEILNRFYLINTKEFSSGFKLQNREKESTRRITFLIIGGLGVISIISLLIASFWRRRLYFYYAIYGLSPLLLLIVKEVCFFILINSTTYQPCINTLSRAAEFLQLVSLAAYIMFVAELLDIKKTSSRIFKTLQPLAVVMILQGIVEVAWLLTTFDIAGYEFLLAWSSSLLFPIFIAVIIWMSIVIRHHLTKYVIISNAIFVGILLLGFLRLYAFKGVQIPVYLDPLFTLPFATLLEMVVFSFAIAAKISYDNNLRVKSEKQLRETEMMALRSQMNPHFIFNSLNTIRNFILQNDNANANKYLAKFSKLLRQILSYSRSNTISLADEIETVKLYLELESARFKSGFHYEIILSPDLDVDAIRMPPLLLQPYAENAIWHGLRHSNREEKIIWLSFSEEAEALKISIKDNGIGRKAAAKFRSETKDSLGTKITKERIELFNQTENSNISVETIDSPQGTEVILTYRLN